ncbi:MAG: hypothetical protein ACFFD5_07165 [Candidatus Thorarchaeota archaeon]
MVELSTTILGISLALTATICFNLAFILQKKGLNQGLPEINFDGGIINVIKSFLAFFQNKTWITGFILGILGWFPYIISTGLVGILVVQPLMSLGLVIFVIAAHQVLKEKVTILEIIAIVLLGIVPILITSAGISDVNIDLYSFVGPLLIFLGITLTIGFLCFIISKRKRKTPLEGLFILFTGGIFYAFGLIFTNILAQAITDAHVFPLYFWEILFGIFWFDYYHLWLFLGFWGMVISNIISITFYQSAFQKGKALTMYPILNSFILIIPLLAGLFVFNQSFMNFPLFFIAVFIVLIANITLSKFQAQIETIEISKKSEK